MPFRVKPLTCEGCGLHSVGQSFVRAEGPPEAKLVLVGQGPGRDEAFDGRPFVGVSGRLLDRWLARAGIPRHKVAIGNVIWCWAPKDRPGAHSEVAHCRRTLWEPWLRTLTQRRVVVAVGVPAMQALINPRAKSSWVGDYHQGEFGWTVGIFHPAAILRGGWPEEPFQVKTLQRAWELCNETRPDPTPITQYYETSPPGSSVATSVDQLVLFRKQVGPRGVAFDLETVGPHIRLIGFATIDPPHRCLSVPIRTQGCEFYWKNYDEFQLVVAELWDWFNDPTLYKWGHNAQSFDVPVLEENGFEVRGFVGDTMLGSHIALPEMPKSLEYLSKLHLAVPGWKWLAGEDGQEGK